MYKGKEEKEKRLNCCYYYKLLLTTTTTWSQRAFCERSYAETFPSRRHVLHQRNVPRALQTSLGCAQIWRSLKTSDASRAAVRAQAKHAEIERHFAQARVKLETFAGLNMVEALTAERRQYGTRGAVALLRAHRIPALLHRYRAITLACDDDERPAIGNTPRVNVVKHS